MNRLPLLCAIVCAAVATGAAEEPPPAKPAPKPPTPANFSDRVFRPADAGQPPKLNPPAALNRAAPQPWPLFAPNELPDGATVNESEALHLAEGSYASQNTYLTGSLIVTASGGNRAVLRFAAARSPVRVIVEYPPGRALPAEDATLKVDRQSGLLITEVRRVGENPLTIRVREIIDPAAKPK